VINESSSVGAYIASPQANRSEVASAASVAWSGRSVSEGLLILRQRLEALQAQLPVLYRQYADLCEPEGVRFLGFGIDPAFGGCVDGLVQLDLAHLRPAKRARYLARALRQAVQLPG